MNTVTDYTAELAARFGVESRSLRVADVVSFLGFELAGMRANGYDALVVAQSGRHNKLIEGFGANEIIGPYLASATPMRVFMASGVRLLPLSLIRESILDLAPGAVLFPHGFLPFARSIGGNELCFCLQTGGVVWADHSVFYATDQDSLCVEDPELGELVDAPFTPETIRRALPVVAVDFWAFLLQVLRGTVADRLEVLDRS